MKHKKQQEEKDKKLPKEFQDPVLMAKQSEESLRLLLNVLPKDAEDAENTIHRLCEMLNQIQNDIPKDDYGKIELMWKFKQKFIKLVTCELPRDFANSRYATLFKIALHVDIIIYHYYHKFIKETYNIIKDKKFAEAEKRRQCFEELTNKLKEYEKEYDNDVIKSKIDPTQKGPLQGVLKIYKVDYVQDKEYIDKAIINFDVYTEEVKTPKLDIKDKDELAIEAEKNKPAEPGLIKKVINFIKNKTKKNDKQKEGE